MHICVYNTAYGYIRVARYTSAAVVITVTLFLCGRRKICITSTIAVVTGRFFLIGGKRKNEQRAYSTTSIIRWQHSNTRN